MEKGLRYIVDEKGHRLAVIIPIAAWNNLNEKYEKCLKKVSVLTGIQRGLEEVKKTAKTRNNLKR